MIDEFHHAAGLDATGGSSTTWSPSELLGLTATPERADGFDVRAFFGGRIASSCGCGTRSAQDLLCPFHYFGIADGTDLTQVAWTRGRYDDAELANLYTGNSARAAIVLKQLQDKVADVAQMRALGFCVVDRPRRLHGPRLQRGRDPGSRRQRARLATSTATQPSPTCGLAA